MPCAGSEMSSGMHTSTPPMASTMSSKPAKSTTTKWSTRTPVICSNCWIVHAGPPTENASFHITSVPPGIVSPSLVLHSGRVTRESRGMLMPYARFRSAETCNRIVVSERWPPPVRLSMLLPSPSRVSDPITRTFSGSLGPSTSFLSGRFSSWSATSRAVRLPLRWR